MHDIYVYMQDNYIYIIAYQFFTQIKIYVVQWKTYVVMSLQGHRSNHIHDIVTVEVWKRKVDSSHTCRKWHFCNKMCLTFQILTNFDPSFRRYRMTTTAVLSVSVYLLGETDLLVTVTRWAGAGRRCQILEADYWTPHCALRYDVS